MKKLFSEVRDIAAYRGGEGHWAYVFHRITGVGVLLFLFAHIVDTALVGWGPEVYNKAIALYRHPFFRVNEIGLFAAVLYHSLNGLRIVVIDFWPNSTKHHKRLFWTEVVLFVLIMLPVTYMMAMPIIKGGHR